MFDHICNFKMNGYNWRIIKVAPFSGYLIDRFGKLTVGTTDPSTQTIYISSDIQGDFFTKVVVHELGHAAMFSYFLVDDIHRAVIPSLWIEAEEWVCNFLSDYGIKIFQVLYDLYL